MKHTVKFVTLLLAFVMAFSFAACGETPPPQQEEVQAESITLSGMKTQFANGEPFSSEGLSVTVLYSDETTRTASPLEYTVDSSAYRAETAGSYEIKVTLGSLSEKYSVTVAEKTEEVTVLSLVLSGMKTNFALNEAFSSEGLVVTAHLSDGTDKVLASTEYEVDSSAYQSGTAGQYQIKVSCGEVNQSYTVTVAQNIQGSWEEDGVLKILMIGNSYTQDTAEYVWEIADSLGLDCFLGLCFIGGTSIDDHLNNISKNAAKYNYCTKTSNVWNNTFGNRLADVLAAQDWDFVTIQQQSMESGVKESYIHLEEYIDYVRTACPRATLGWIMPWSDAVESQNEQFLEMYEGQMQMYEAVLDATKSEVEPFGLQIVPSGTAVQNARTSFIGDTLNRDGHHLTLGLGRYLSGLTLVAKLTGLSLKGLEYFPSKEVGADAVTVRQQTAAIEAAENAVKNPYEVTPSKYR